MNKRQIIKTLMQILLFVFVSNSHAEECKSEDIITWENYKDVPIEVCLEKTNNPEWPNWCEPDKTAWPNSFFVDSAGIIYLADPADSRIIVYSPTKKTYKEIYLYQSKAKVTLFSIGLTARNTIIVANKSKGKVEEYDLAGKRLKYIDWDGFYPIRIETTVNGRIFLLRPYGREPLDQIYKFSNYIYPPSKGYDQKIVNQYQGYRIRYREDTKSGKIISRKLTVSDDLGHVIKECTNLNLMDEIPPYPTTSGYLYFMPFSKNKEPNKRYRISRIKIRSE